MTDTATMKMLVCSFCARKGYAKRRHIWTPPHTMANDSLSERRGQDFPEGLWRCTACMTPYSA